MKTLFENAVVLTMDDDMRLISNGYVLTEGKNIAEVGEAHTAVKRMNALMRTAVFCSPDL